MDRSKLELDLPATTVEKLGSTVLFVVLGGFLFLFSCLAFAGDGKFWWRIPAQIALEICWTFWLSGLCFIWWRPPLLRSLYLSAARRMMQLARLLKLIAIILFMFTAVLVYTLL